MCNAPLLPCPVLHLQVPSPRAGQGQGPRQLPPGEGGGARKRREEFTYGPLGPYSNRAPVQGKEPGLDLAAPYLSCMYSTHRDGPR